MSLRSAVLVLFAGAAFLSAAVIAVGPFAHRETVDFVMPTDIKVTRR
jgi:hypothetical protein